MISVSRGMGRKQYASDWKLVWESVRFYEESWDLFYQTPSSFKFNGACVLMLALSRVDQVFFHDPDGYIIELCNYENIPIIPLASCSFKPRLSSLIKTAPAKCGFMENAMMESLSMEMLNVSF
ncbi:hypothetical protein V6N11_076553 [Hibiscus sabdariffa]|uniref:Uncharacterized protein n=1 Tax=Hibiscus sabdariffa TaxID=183260 RepID=A0ABR2Q6N2_9ROSI